MWALHQHQCDMRNRMFPMHTSILSTVQGCQLDVWSSDKYTLVYTVFTFTTVVGQPFNMQNVINLNLYSQ